MTTDPDDEFDHRARQLHAAALTSLSPRTLATLRAAHQATVRRSRSLPAWRWVAATAFSTVIAVAIGIQILPRSSTPSASLQPGLTVADDVEDATDDYSDSLDENPDLFVWLASADARQLTLE